MATVKLTTEKMGELLEAVNGADADDAMAIAKSDYGWTKSGKSSVAELQQFKNWINRKRDKIVEGILETVALAQPDADSEELKASFQEARDSEDETVKVNNRLEYLKRILPDETVEAIESKIPNIAVGSRGRQTVFRKQTALLDMFGIDVSQFTIAR